MLKEQLEIFRNLKSKSELSNQQISERSGLSLSTVNRFFRGEIDNPPFDEVNRIITAMGYTLTTLLDTETISISRYNIDELLVPYAERIAAPFRQQIALLSNDNAHLLESLATQRRITRISFGVSAFLLIIVIVFFVLFSI